MPISRRRALAGATAAVVAAVTIPASPALADDPLIELCARLRAAWKAWNIADDAVDAARVAGRGQSQARLEAERCGTRFREIETQLLDTPARTVGGIKIKMEAWFAEGEGALILDHGESWDSLPQEWVASIYRDLHRLAGEARS